MKPCLGALVLLGCSAVCVNAGPPASPRDKPIELTPKLMGVFVNKVQPILMNTCARCHAVERTGNFQLMRTTPGTVPNPKTTQANLAALAAHVHRENIADSAVLTKALAAHGGGSQPPLRDRQNMAYRTLEEFTRQAFANADAVAGSKPTESMEPDTPPVDPFDPDIFNRAAHPAKK